jgi:F-type H+-transporting ATPase subunit epsilon
MAGKLDLRVISPAAATDKSPYKLQASVDMVILRCTTGELGILPGRMPCSMTLGSGPMRILNEGTETRWHVEGGVAHVSGDIVTVLSDKVTEE